MTAVAYKNWYLNLLKNFKNTIYPYYTSEYSRQASPSVLKTITFKKAIKHYVLIGANNHNYLYLLLFTTHKMLSKNCVGQFCALLVDVLVLVIHSELALTDISKKSSIHTQNEVVSSTVNKNNSFMLLTKNYDLKHKTEGMNENAAPERLP